jgi:hypothetical protein
MVKSSTSSTPKAMLDQILLTVGLRQQEQHATPTLKRLRLGSRKAGIAVIPVPNRGTLVTLSQQVDQNNGSVNQSPDQTMAYLRTKIKHIVYVIKKIALTIRSSVTYPSATATPH